jgi:hypothetical protein
LKEQEQAYLCCAGKLLTGNLGSLCEQQPLKALRAPCCEPMSSIFETAKPTAGLAGPQKPAVLV